MTDYIKEFGEDQKNKKIKVKFEPPEEWGFEPQVSQKSFDKSEKSIEDPFKNSDEFGFAVENKILKTDLKSVVTEMVLGFMNQPDPNPIELLQEQKIELENKIKEYCKRPGMMSLYFSDEPQLNEAFVGAIIDPTNRKNWIAMKQEIIYKVPYSCCKSLQEYATKIWNENKLV